jgi:hypothetical protein
VDGRGKKARAEAFRLAGARGHRLRFGPGVWHGRDWGRRVQTNRKRPVPRRPRLRRPARAAVFDVGHRRRCMHPFLRRCVLARVGHRQRSRTRRDPCVRLRHRQPSMRRAWSEPRSIAPKRSSVRMAHSSCPVDDPRSVHAGCCLRRRVGGVRRQSAGGGSVPGSFSCSTACTGIRMRSA